MRKIKSVVSQMSWAGLDPSDLLHGQLASPLYLTDFP